MEGDAVKRIVDLAIRSTQIEKDGTTFVSQDFRPLGIVHTQAVEFTTLTSFCHFIERNPQGLDLNGAIITIDRDFEVRLLSAPDPLDGARTVYALAKRHSFRGVEFGNQYAVEDFIIALKSKFVKEDSDWEQVFELAKKVTVEDSVELNDDGMSQRVTVKQGVSAASLTTVNKPTDHALRPYRIFPEVEQPKSIFFMRISGNKSTGAYIALFETDGGKWKVDASEIIKRFIEDHLFDSTANIPVYC